VLHNRESVLLLLRVANIRHDHFDLVRRDAFIRERVRRFLVFSTVCDHVGQVGVGQLLGIVGNQTGNLRRRLSPEIGAVSGSALGLIESRAILRPREVGQNQE
jgi:hypothetical protein